ncbi:NAD(P)H-quinone oxidoreductase [Rothia sp. ZJ1223]|uniref:NAD(P)H-quinone oxidoreductase n=1 Tax=Rothia sp. ZJ1223 TaxID=2811098 RepID=UPI0019561921|nr:NAD(P)H-quinone oxidoreductase [Rothia sp. ZJ1223]
MKAVIENEHGAPGVLEVTETDKPQVGAGQVLVRIAAAGLNRADVVQRKGHYPPPAGESKIYGLEAAGVIEEVGAGVPASRVGQKVMVLLASGGYAEYVAVDARCAIDIPEGLSLVEAACLPEVAATVYSNLVMVAGVSTDPRDNAGKSVLIHGGSGGIGAHAIQLCVALGLRVFSTAGTSEKCDYIESLGAEPINYREQDFEQLVDEKTEGAGVNFIFDMVGGAYLSQHLRALALDGSMVTIAVQGGKVGEFDLSLAMKKRLNIYGRTLRAQSLDYKARVLEGVEQYVVPLVKEGKISPNLHKTFPFGEVTAAHEYFDSGQHRGKVVLVME